jgi:hypothetical protein
VDCGGVVLGGAAGVVLGDAIVPAQPAAWGLQIGVQRGEAYAAAKRAFRDQMMAGADQVLPGLSSAVVFEDAATF